MKKAGVVGLVLACGLALGQDTTTTLFKESPLCKYESNVKILEETLRVTDDMTHVACVMKKRDKQYVAMNGKLGKPYLEIVLPKGGINTAATGVPSLGGGASFLTPRDAIRFSPDWTRMGYTAKSEKGYVVSVDDRESDVFELILDGMPLFSPDSRHWGFAGIKKGKIYVVQDGVMGKPLDDLQVGSLTWSPDGQTLVYCAREGNKWLIYAGKKQYDALQGISETSVRFSPDAQRVAYAAVHKGKWYVLVDGKPVHQAPYEAVAQGMPVWSEDSKRYAYAAQRAGLWWMCTDGKEYGPYTAISEGTPIFSRTSKELAFGAQKGKAWSVMRQEKATEKPVEAATGDALLNGTPRYSKNGKELLYAVSRGGYWYVFPNPSAPQVTGQSPNPKEKEGGAPTTGYAAIKEGTLRITADGSKVVFAARKGDRWVIVQNGKELPYLYEEIGPIRMSSDEGTGTVAIAAKRRGAWLVILNGEEAYRWYYEMLLEALVVSQNGKRVSYYARAQGKWELWIDGVPQQCNIPYSYRFNPDTALIEGVTREKNVAAFNLIRESR